MSKYHIVESVENLTNECCLPECNKPKNKKGYCEMHYYRLRRNGYLYIQKQRDNIKLDFSINENGCFICTSHYKLSNGYHLINRNEKRISAHRFVYQQMFGEIPEGLLIRHKCDNKSCINPEHLETGTVLDNSRDMVERNRSLKGEKHPGRKLTEKQVLEIRQLAFYGFKRKDICAWYGLKNIDTITSIKYGHSWGHLREGIK